MAKHVIIESYTFTPSTNTIVVNGKNIRREQLLLITNVTRGTVIYNFSDPSLGAASYTNYPSTTQGGTTTVSVTSGVETTTIVTTYNTSSMSSTDKLAIMVEESYTEITPSETLQDPVGKLRVSLPQSLIDTDFEYGLQPTKWEAISLLNNRPSAFYDVTAPINNTATSITGIAATASGTVTTITVTGTGMPTTTVGSPIFMIGALDPIADGWGLVTASSSTSLAFSIVNLSYTAAALYDATKTYIYFGTFYTGAGIPVSASAGAAIAVSAGTATVTTTASHGLAVGNHVYVVGTTGATGVMNGVWSVATTPTNNTFTFACAATGTITAAAGATTTLFTRTQGYTTHRAFDGGVQFTNQLPFHNYQVIRQTRRYFRYQSGKGIQFSTGSIMKPALTVDAITSSGTTVTVTCKYPHGLSLGSQVQVSGCNETAYNGVFSVATAPTVLTFTYVALTTPSASTATVVQPASRFIVSPYSWYGGKNRIGMFDHQNGFFFEYDGQQLYAVRRSSVTQISGMCAITNGTNTVTGTNTYFSNQLKPGNDIVIRGMSYKVMSIISDTSMQIYPEYRGPSAITNAVISKTIDTRYPQSSWNIDKMDGTGASQYNIDLSKMQMFYADYTWYGAGAIRFGFKNNRGEVIYCHRIPNNNVNIEAYMRSGNLPARYETNTFPDYTYLTATLANTATTGATISVADTSMFPNAGTVAITASGATAAAIEYISYTAKTATTLTIGARTQTGGNGTAQTFTYSATAPIKVELFSPAQASTISHWGSSVIMDGRFDDDKSFVFNYGMNLPVTYSTAQTRYPVFSIRLSPSVDNGLTGILGAREILNRMQLTPVSCDVYCTTSVGVKVEIFLNAKLSAGTFAPVGGSSLAQYAQHTNTTTISGGESIFTFFAPGSGLNSQDLVKVRDIGTSILSGGTSLTCPTTDLNKFPDGPDILTVCITPLASTAIVVARLNWTEAQA